MPYQDKNYTGGLEYINPEVSLLFYHNRLPIIADRLDMSGLTVQHDRYCKERFFKYSVKIL